VSSVQRFISRSTGERCNGLNLAASATRFQYASSAARAPSAAARALDHKLGGPPSERRYTAPSYIIEGFSVPGFNPVEAYEVAIANIAPGLVRWPKPETVLELLEWAPEPLATAEAASIMQMSIERTRAELKRVGAFEPAGADGYWTLAG